jgi:hypothetical protein
MATQASAVFAVLLDRVGFEVVQHSESPNQLRVLGRIPIARAGLKNIDNWVAIIDHILDVMEVRPWKADISKYYFKKKETGKTVYAWRVLLQGENIAQHYADITNVIRTTRAARVDVVEIPLGGAGLDRNNPAGGKRGAGPAGTVAVGPMAVMQKMRGG